MTPADGSPSIIGKDSSHTTPLTTPGATIVGIGLSFTTTTKGSDVIEHAPLVTTTLTSCPLVSDFTNVLEALAGPSETSLTKNSYDAPGTAAAVKVNGSLPHNSAGSGELVSVAVKLGTTFTICILETKVGEVFPEHSIDAKLAMANLLNSVVEVSWPLSGL